MGCNGNGRPAFSWWEGEERVTTREDGRPRVRFCMGVHNLRGEMATEMMRRGRKVRLWRTLQVTGPEQGLMAGFLSSVTGYVLGSLSESKGRV